MKAKLLKYFEGIKLFGNNLTVEQFLYLLEDVVNCLIEDDLNTKCFACSIIDHFERRTKFINESPKFNLQDLMIVWKWTENKKVTGGCNDTRDLITDLAINHETKIDFAKWVELK